MTKLRDNYEKAQQKLETADANLKKFQTRSDRLILANFDEHLRELEDIRCECEQSRTLSRDIHATETYKIASEEYSITIKLLYQYLYEENQVYNNISRYLSSKMPEIEQRLENDDLILLFGYDLIKQCSKRKDTLIAYPIEICICLLENSLNEEGLFRIAPSQGKQKKLGTTLNGFNYDPHVPASTLKQYLRELPDRLLTTALLPQWNRTISLRLTLFSLFLIQLSQTNLFSFIDL
ncbi:unnamed protein product [Rotaria sordida]|uniref:Rho-GAP domain-containing protein n=1 Tax=Rotaria sordida TaxID=392033 RepID=A0A820DLH2_9BILA|nr:unnamed protein product [Rotaria sordida]